jgi:hypothetical protein
MKVRELKGYNSYRALQAFHSLMLGLKMLPAYIGESYEEFYQKVELMPEADQEKLIREAALFVKLDREEMESLLLFCEDPNGVAYDAKSINNLSAEQFMDVIVSVCLEISKIKVKFVTESEKKN